MPEHTVDFQFAFEALPGNFVLLAPDLPHYTILGITEEMLRMSVLQRQDVVGKGVFEVFPENPATPSATGPASLRLSLQQALIPDRRIKCPWCVTIYLMGRETSRSATGWPAIGPY